MRAEQHLDAQGAEPALHHPRDGGVHRGQQGVARLDDRHPGAELRERGAQLDAGTAAPDHRGAGRQGPQRQHVRRVEDPHAVAGHPLELARPRARREDHVAELDEPRGAPVVALDRALAGTGEAEPSGEHPYARAVESAADRVAQALHDLVFEPLELREINGYALKPQARAGHGVGAARRVRHLDQRLARDAAGPQAHAADPGRAVAVDERHLPSQPRRSQRRGVPAGTGPHYQEVDALGDLADDHQRGCAPARRERWAGGAVARGVGGGCVLDRCDTNA